MKEYMQEPHTVPKSFRHWLEKAGIYLDFKQRWREYPVASSRRARFIAGCADDRRHFRVLAHLNRFEICDGHFDRWANSVAAVVPIPRTEAEFNRALDTLLDKAAKRIARW